MNEEHEFTIYLENKGESKMNEEEDEIGMVTTILGRLIRKTALAVSGEQFHPSIDADRMEDIIINGKKRLSVLRRLREEFEDLMTGIL
jgi:hypothetical protein